MEKAFRRIPAIIFSLIIVVFSVFLVIPPCVVSADTGNCGIGPCPEQIVSGYVGGASINSLGEVVWGLPDSQNYGQIYSSIRGQLTSDPVSHYFQTTNNLGDLVWAEYGNNYPSGYTLRGIIAGQPVTLATSQNWIGKADINDRGEVVWITGDSSNINQIFSNLRGQLTSGTTGSFDPSINNHGDIVFISMDPMVPGPGQIYRISAGSTTAVAVTNNSLEHRSPAINDSGEIVWAERDPGSTTYALQVVSNVRGGLVPPANDIFLVDLNNCGDIVYLAATPNVPTLYRLGGNAPCGASSNSSFQIVLNAGSNGSIAGPTSVVLGSTVLYTIIPIPGYHVADVIVDGQSVGPVTLYTLNNVTVDHSISASFAFNPPPVPVPLAQPLVTGVNSGAYVQVQRGGQNPGDIQTYSIINRPANGISSISSTGIFSYLPGLNFSGSDNSVIQVSNQIGLSGSTAVKINVFTEWVKISAGNQYTLALKADGTLWGWGANWYGQLGIGSSDYNQHPEVSQIGNSSDWATVSAGVYSSAAIKKNGTLWTWGSNSNGRLGDGTQEDKLIPVQVGSDSDWIAVSVGQHMVALKSDGTLWSWGDNGYGQLGIGSLASSTVPVRIGNDNDWSGLSAGNWHTVAVKSSGTLWAWGLNYFGELGDGTNENRSVPTQIGMENDWKDSSAGNRHSVAIKLDGSIWSWGDNQSKQLGDNTSSGRNVPGRVGTNSDWVILKGIAYGNLAMKNDGSLWEWGGNHYPYGPVQVGVDIDWAALTTGGGHSLALKSDGTLWSWGWNSYGELGNTTISYRSMPEKIVSPETTLPLVAITSPKNESITSNNPLLAFVVSKGAVTVKLDGEPVNMVSGNTLGPLNNGVHTVRVESRDQAGNTDFSEVAFTVQTYVVTIVSGQNGLITGPDKVGYGEIPSYTITANAGYYIADITVNGLSVGPVSNYTFTSGVTANMTIAAVFAPGTISMLCNNGANGIISGPSSVNYGGSAAYTITPAIGFHVADVQVDGASVGAATSYSFTNITVNHTISASFAINSYFITATAGANGEISGAGPVSVNYGGTVFYTSIIPAVGYHIADVLVDGASVGVVTSYSFANVTANHTISATFAINTFTITMNAGAGGTISGPATVKYGDNPTYTFTPNIGYHVAEVTFNGASFGTLTSYTFSSGVSGINANLTIVAVFAIDTFKVTMNSGANGSISGPSTAIYGSSAGYTITPAVGYHVADVLLDGVSVGAVTSYSLTNVNANHTISATFVALADLVATSVTGPSSATRGRSISVSSPITNQGGTNASSFTVAFYLSKDTTVNSNDTILGTKTVTSLNAGSTTTVSGSFTVPSGMSTGRYYVGVIVDSGTSIVESNESNNRRAAGSFTTVR